MAVPSERNAVSDPWPVGMVLADRRYQFTPGRIDEYLRAMGLSRDVYATRSPYPFPICPPGILCYQPSAVAGWLDHPRRPGRTAFNSSTEWRFNKPMLPGSEVTLGWRVTDRWLKRGKEFVTYEMPVIDAGGEVLCLNRSSEAVLDPPVYDPPLENRDAHASASLQAETGVEWGRISRAISADMSRALVGPLVNWHTDIDVAKARGLENVLLLGAHFVGLMIELSTQVFGRGFCEGGWLRTYALRPVLADEPITIRLHETGRETGPEGSVRVKFAVWCEDEKMGKTAAGIGSARLLDGAPRRVEELGS